MLKKSLAITLSLVAAVVLLTGLWPATTSAQQGITAGNFIFINYIGRELYLDLDDVNYLIPGTDTAPEGGQLILTLPVGDHKFAANAPGVPSGYAGEFSLAPGQIVAKAARIDQSNPVVERGILLAEPKDFVHVFDFDPFAVPVEAVLPVDTWQPSAAVPAMGSLVLINYIGHELTFDLSGRLYKVPLPAHNIPGRLQIDVVPGDYRYTASVPNGSLNSEVTVVAGQVKGLIITADPLPEPVYEVGEEFDILPSIAMKLFEEDLSSQARATTTPIVSDTAPPFLPETGGDINPVVVDPPVVTADLLIKNFAGDVLTLTINNQIYAIPTGAEQALSLPPGRYTYTASTPGLATGGQVDLTAGRGIELSIAINVAHDFLHVYQN